MPNVSSAVSPPILSTLRRRSLIESSLTAPSSVQPRVRAASVVRRNRLMA
jgi:hypothetical protein